MTLRRALATALTLSTAAGVLAAAAPATAHGDRSAPDLTVMSRNVYLGADIDRPVRAALAAQAAGQSAPEVAVALANATHESRANVDKTDFAVRSRLLARELVRTRPDLVGLQEVALWRSGPLDLAAVGRADAEKVDYDFLALLLDRLERAGTPYEAVQVAERADVESPSFTGSPLDGTIGGDVRDVRLTMRDVILRRVGARDVRVQDSGSTVYAANLAVEVAGATLSFTRGFNWVDVWHHRRPLRFVNTHLEAASADLALAQVRQLAEETRSDRGTVLVCDCNSQPGDDTVNPGDKAPQRAAYDALIAAGFRDQWLRWAPGSRGSTYGLGELVDQPAGTFEDRIDFVMYRDEAGRARPRVDWALATGTSPHVRDARTGLWPSDHAGVVVDLVFGSRHRWWRPTWAG